MNDSNSTALLAPTVEADLRTFEAGLESLHGFLTAADTPPWCFFSETVAALRRIEKWLGVRQ